MKYITLSLSLLIFSLFAVLLNAEESSQIVNQEDLVVARGEPSEQWQFEEQGALFAHYYYQLENWSFIIDLETGLVCNQYQGQSKGSCYPCEKKQVTSECP